jgi:hypothetical protein
MHPALILLLRLRQRAFWRRTLSSFKTPRGAALLLATGVFLAFIVLPQLLMPLLMAFSPEGAEANRVLVEATRPILRTLLPVILLAFVLLAVATSWGESAIYFTPADVDFLFSGPFSRRDLLLYKLAQSVRGNLLAGTFFALFAVRYAPLMAGAWLGSVLTLLFLNGLTLTITLLSQIVSQRADTQWRRLVLTGIAILLVLALAAGLQDFEFTELLDGLIRFHDSLAGRILFAPFDVFARLVVAPTVAELTIWAAIATAMVAGLYGLSISLDANYLEAGLRVSQRHYERLQRRGKGGGALATIPIGGAHRIRLPQPRWLFGVGPNLWRQWVLLARNAPGLLLFAIGALVMTGVLIVLRRQATDKMPFVMPLAVMGALVYQSLLAAIQLPSGFRGDIDRMDWLKALPLHPLAIVTGQVGGVVLVLSLVQAAMVLTAWLTCGGTYQIYASGVLLILPVNLLFFGVENLIFLIFPLRISAATAGDFQFMGKFTLLAMFKMFIVGAGLGVAAAGGIVYLLVPRWWLAVGCSSILLLGINAIILFLATKAFERFDISLDTPPA